MKFAAELLNLCSAETRLPLVPIKEATKLSAKAFNDLCYMHTPEQVKELMGMMPEVLDLTLPEGILWLAFNQDILS